MGQPLYSIRRKPLFILEEDTVGVHDLLAPACDTMRYQEDFGIEGHPSCRENLNGALRELGYSPPGYPDPVNLFQNTPIADLQGTRDTRESMAKPGDYVLLRAEEDLIAVVSACPQDQTNLQRRPVQGAGAGRSTLSAYPMSPFPLAGGRACPELAEGLGWG